MKQFRLVDNLMGWITFAIAAFVYCSTVEPTASFWDCPEFITTAYKLEVGHPPGAPFFMLTGNLFTQFVSDPTKVALMVNIMSALFSAACIMFLFWSISHLTRKLVGTNGKISTLGQLITVEASALTGALIYTFSDTFWYSAVEGEVYAYSSLFTAVVFSRAKSMVFMLLASPPYSACSTRQRLTVTWRPMSMVIQPEP